MSTSWTETSPGTFRRKMGVFEKNMADYMSPAIWNGRENYVLSVVVKFRLSDALLKDNTSAMLLKNAWKALRFQLPHLAAVRDGDDKIYTVPTQEDVEQWLDETFVVISDATIKPEEYFATLDPSPALPVLFYFKASGDVLFRCSHWRIDCDGALLTLDRLFSFAVDQPKHLTWGDEVKNLTPSFFEHLELPERPTEQVQAYTTSMFGNYGATLPSAGYQLREQSPALSPTGTRTTKLRISSASTAAFAAVCKQAKHTVTSAVHTALAWTAYTMAPPSLQGRPQGGLILRDQRRQLQPPLRMHNFVLDCGMTAQFITLPPQGMSYEELGDIFIRKYRDAFDAQLHMQASDEIAKGCLSMVSTPLPEGVPFPTHPWLSSLGIVEKFLSRSHQSDSDARHTAELLGIRLLVDVPGPQFTVWLYSWRGEMCMETCFNSVFYSDEYAQTVLRTVHDTLEREWKVELKLT